MQNDLVLISKQQEYSTKNYTSFENFFLLLYLKQARQIRVKLEPSYFWILIAYSILLFFVWRKWSYIKSDGFQCLHLLGYWQVAFASPCHTCCRVYIITCVYIYIYICGNRSKLIDSQCSFRRLSTQNRNKRTALIPAARRRGDGRVGGVHITFSKYTESDILFTVGWRNDR